MAARSKTVLFILVLAAAVGAAAQDNNEPERRQAESELQQVLENIAAVQRDIQDSRARHAREQERLRNLDLAIQEINLRLRKLDQEKNAHKNDLADLEQQQQDYLDSLEEGLAQLARQVRAAYRSGQHSRTQLVLNQDDPTRISRMLAYYDYINRAQVEKISGLREALTRLESLQNGIDTELAKLSELQTEQEQSLAELTGQRTSRSLLLQEISGKIDSREAALRELEANRRDLESLIERLADVLGDIPENLDSQAGIAGQKGRLPMPVRGPVRHAFGQDRSAGLDWQGWLIGAEPGTEVRAVAYGRVAFADWLRGYGLLLIIDHGDGYMTLYGHNESLLRDAGEWIEAGSAISVVGSNPGNTQGAYFELRRNGKAVDPAAWLAR